MTIYLELCLLNQICRNGDQIFRLRPGEEYECEYSAQRFRELQRLLLTPARPAPPSAMRCTHATLAKLHERDAMDEAGLPSCSTCWRANNGPGDCSKVRGCNKLRCDFCTNAPVSGSGPT